MNKYVIAALSIAVAIGPASALDVGLGGNVGGIGVGAGLGLGKGGASVRRKARAEMNLSARIRMEALTASQCRHIQIVGADEAHAARQVEDAILAAGPGQITVEFIIDGRSLAKETWNILSHEENLERLQ